MLPIALALAAANDPPADFLRESLAGWPTQIEDDLTHRQARVSDAATAGCTTTMTGEQGSWTVDWRKVRTVALEDVFVFLEGPQLKLAVVTDVQNGADQARLRAMWTAMRTLATRCGGEGPHAVDDAGVTLP